MNIIDTHCHLNILPEEKVGNIDTVIAQAKEQNVNRMMCVGIDPEHWDEIITLAEKYPEVYAAVGIHPCEPPETPLDEARLTELTQHPKVLMIGEIGLDYYHFEPDSDLSWQHDRLRQQIAIAKKVNKPIVIHTRNSTPDLLQILKEEQADQVGGIMHCFVEDIETAEKAMNLGFYISFSGIVTFKNAKALKEVAKQIPEERLLVETDSPYLAPVPYRGKTNQPAYTRYVVEELALLRGVSPEQIAQATTANFQRLTQNDLALR